MVDKPRVAFIGLGNMGSRMAGRLLAAEFPLTVFDMSSTAVSSFDALAEVTRTAAAAASQADVICTSLPGPEAVRMVYDEVLEVIPAGAVAIDFSTVDPGTATHVAQLCSARGVEFLDAPVSRGVQAAALGTLSIMVGGEEATLNRVRPVLDQLATSIVHCGAHGSGQMVKLCNNMVAAITMVGLGEVLVAGVRNGLTTEMLFRVLQSSSAGSHILAEYFPRVVFSSSRPTGFALDFMVKDIDLYLRAVEDGTTRTVLGSTVRDVFAACQAEGLGSRDATAVVEFFERAADVRLRIDEVSA